MARKVREDMILRQLAKRHAEDVFFTHVKNGPTVFGGLLVMDAVAIKKSWAKPCITIYEVKTSRNDFVRDEKWPQYKDYCHRMYFACPTGMISPAELPNDVGLVYYNPEMDSITTRKKPAIRPIEIPWEMLYYLLLYRVDSDHSHPFFSTQREMLEAWVQDKADRRNLGYFVSRKLAKTLKENEELRTKVGIMEKEVELLEEMREIMGRAGYRTYNWAIKEELERALNSELPRGIEVAARNIKNEVERLEKIVAAADRKSVV